MKLTIAYCTSRYEPRLDWFLTSLYHQIRTGDELDLIVVDTTEREGVFRDGHFRRTVYTQPKPTVWQGKHRLTQADWWAASNSRNTAICLCQTDWIAFLDDRCVLQRNWLNTIRNAQERGYAVCGTYEKRTGMTVVNGVIQHGGIVIGEDSRLKYVREHRGSITPTPCPGSWMFGCTLALPLEWCLQVNGFEELCDGMGMEDVVFGSMIEANGFPIMFDHRMAVVQDRTPKHCGPVMVKTSKRRFDRDPEAKDFAALKKFSGQKRTQHQWDLRAVRDSVLKGEPFPIPTGPDRDWYDNQPLKEMTP